MLQSIQLERPVAQAVEAGRTAAAHQRAQARQQLVELERLRQIVVGPRVQPPHHVLGRIPRREHQDGGVPPLPAQLRGHLKPILLGQHEIQQDRVIVVDMREHGGLVAVLGDIHGVALFAQPHLDEAGDLTVVLDD